MSLKYFAIDFCEIYQTKRLEFRSEVKTCLQNAKKPKFNLGKEQRKALRKLREDDSS